MHANTKQPQFDILEFDVIIIGGGATGFGIALESILRGYKTLLLEAHDFGSGASSKSTKLLHGGIRYLKNFDFSLVKEGLDEREYFLHNASNIAKMHEYIIPCYSYREQFMYIIGVLVYNILAKLNWRTIVKTLLSPFKSHKPYSSYNSVASKSFTNNRIYISKQELIQLMPLIKQKNLKCGIAYTDGQFDDTRMIISLMTKFISLGGVCYNYTKVTEFIKNTKNEIIGVIAGSNNKHFMSKVVINATGVFADELINLSNIAHQKNTNHSTTNQQEQHKEHKSNNITPAQGSHIILSNNLLKVSKAIVIPKTPDKRILFILPWLYNTVVVGTTDIKVPNPAIEPHATDTEVELILESLNNYTKTTITTKDIISIFSGQRPLVHDHGNQQNNKTAKISRKHKIIIATNKLVSVIGGKWTIYRKMGFDTLELLLKRNLLVPKLASPNNLNAIDSTKSAKLSKECQLSQQNNQAYPLTVYGENYKKIFEIQAELNDYSTLHDELPYYIAEVVYHVRFEMAQNIIDVLARRTHAILLNPIVCLKILTKVAQIMAFELKYDELWQKNQILEATNFIKHYIYNK